jgi:uncharacterized membrane protein
MKMTWNYDIPLWVTILCWVFGIILGIGIFFGILCLESWLIMLLWNATLPLVFSGVTTISFWQSVGISLLVTLLWGGVGKTIAAFTKEN